MKSVLPLVLMALTSASAFAQTQQPTGDGPSNQNITPFYPIPNVAVFNYETTLVCDQVVSKVEDCGNLGIKALNDDFDISGTHQISRVLWLNTNLEQLKNTKKQLRKLLKQTFQIAEMYPNFPAITNPVSDWQSDKKIIPVLAALEITGSYISSAVTFPVRYPLNLLKPVKKSNQIIEGLSTIARNGEKPTYLENWYIYHELSLMIQLHGELATLGETAALK